MLSAETTKAPQCRRRFACALPDGPIPWRTRCVSGARSSPCTRMDPPVAAALHIQPGRSLQLLQPWCRGSALCRASTSWRSDMKLRQLAHCRTGDKGDISNVAVIVYCPEDYALVEQHL